ncbi:MAG: hypothetical protein HY757_02845 [Nitrospirae bacterium]|nr:hypothetical protein [Nitrospirota bacterium]
MSFNYIAIMREYAVLRQYRLKMSALLIAFCSLIFLSGCSASSSKQYVRPSLNIGAFKRVAVLPLENYTSDKYANEIIRSKIIIELLSRGIDVIEPGEVVVTMKELKVRSLNALSVEDIKIMGEMLKIDAVIVGSVERYGISKGISVSYPEVSVQLMLFESATGSIAWSVWHTTGGASFWTRHFGAEGPTLDKTSAQVIKKAFDTLFNKMPVYAKPHSMEIIEEKGTALSEGKIKQPEKKIREVPAGKLSGESEETMVGKPIRVRMAEPAEKAKHIEKIEELSAGEVSRKTEGELIPPVAGGNIGSVEKTRFTRQTNDY